MLTLGFLPTAPVMCGVRTEDLVGRGSGDDGPSPAAPHLQHPGRRPQGPREGREVFQVPLIPTPGHSSP